MKKKISKLALILVFAMLFSFVLTACQSNGANNTAGDAAAGGNTSDNAASDAGTGSDDVNWPNGTITLRCGFGAGGSTDVMCRTLAARLSQELGVDVVVENLTGAGGWICYQDMLSQKEPDGNILYQVNPSFLLGKYDEANPHVQYLDDYIPLANHESDPNVIVVRSNDDRFSDLESLIEYSKTTPVLVAVVATGVQSDDCTTMQFFADNYGFQYETVTVDSAKDSEVMFLNGSVDILVVNVGDIFSNYKSGDYNVLCVTSDERSPLMSDIPTAKEQGYDIVNSSDRGYGYPLGVDERIVEKMAAALETCMSDPEVIASLEATGAATDVMMLEDYENHLKNYVTRVTGAWGVELKENW